MKTLFVPGGAGFIGSNFIRHWLNEHPDDLVVNYDALAYAGNLENLVDVSLKYTDRYRFIQGDIRDKARLTMLLQAIKPDYIVNFAAESHNSRAIIDPVLFFETNVVGTQQLLLAATEAEVSHFHHISTCEVYGDMPLDAVGAFSEDSAYRPCGPYSASKAAADWAVKAHSATFDLPITISNCCNNYGAFQFPEKLIPLFIVALLRGDDLPMYSNSHYQREWLHVSDHCKGIERVITKGTLGEAYNIGSGVELSVDQIADKILQHMGLGTDRKKFVPDRPNHDRRYLLDSSKIRRELSWRDEVSFDDGFTETIHWYLNNKQWWEPLLSVLAIQEDQW